MDISTLITEINVISSDIKTAFSPLVSVGRTIAGIVPLFWLCIKIWRIMVTGEADGSATHRTTGNKFSANISLEEGQLALKPLNYTPKRLLGLDLSDAQRHQLMFGESIFLEGLTSKTDKKFNATITFDTMHGIKFDFEKKMTTPEIAVESPKIEKPIKIHLLEDSACKGHLKKTPS